MKRAYWDRLAESYSERVFEITSYDRNGVLAGVAAALSRPAGVAADFGCGVGATTRLLAPSFGRVIGIDFSPKLLAEARRRTRSDNVEYLEADLASREELGIAADVGFCVNCLISPSFDNRSRIVRQVARCLRPRARAAFVVPSFESVLRTYQAMVRLDVEAGARRQAASKRIAALAAREILAADDGIVAIGGEPTKHYLGDEIVQFLEDADFSVDRLDRVEYAWEVELDADMQGGTAVLGRRTPWDWLVLGKRGRGRA